MGRVGRAFGIGLAVVVALLVGGWLALRRPDIPYPKLEAKYADAHSHYLGLPSGLRVHVHDEGRRDGPPIVLIHGFSASSLDWNAWAERLGGEYRIVRLDLPGHGLTRAPPGWTPSRDAYVDVVDAATRRLSLRRFVLVGNSMGGGVAWAYALKHPGQPLALVLVDAAGWPERGPNRSSPLIFRVLRNLVGRALVKDLDVRSLTRRGLEDAFLVHKLVTAQLVDRYVELARAPGHRDILVGLQTARDPPADPAKLATIRIPTLVMHGRGDKLIPFSSGEGFARAIPGAQLDVYDGVGHVPMEQIPDRSAEDLRRFLRAHGIG